jgi:hypothetical protein
LGKAQRKSPEIGTRLFMSHLIKLSIIVSSVLACSLVAMAQDPGPTPQPTPLTAPPPLHTISKEERSQIEGATDNNKRLKLTIEFAQGHLLTAERDTSQNNYESASYEVGSYYALIKNALTYLATLKRDSNKTRDLYKRLELALRGDGPRLTQMRRITPLEFAVWIKEVEDFARESRTEALNSFYGHTVVRDSQKPEEKPNEKPNP